MVFIFLLVPLFRTYTVATISLTSTNNLISSSCLCRNDNYRKKSTPLAHPWNELLLACSCEANHRALMPASLET